MTLGRLGMSIQVLATACALALGICASLAQAHADARSRMRKAFEEARQRSGRIDAQ